LTNHIIVELGWARAHDSSIALRFARSRWELKVRDQSILA